MAIMKKPANIIYGVEESPPLMVTIFNGIQHVGVVAINLVYPLLVFRTAGATPEFITSLLGAGMIILGLATFLQVSRLGPVGSGYMCPATFTATYLAPSLLAAKFGGLPLVFGMTIVGGLFETALAPLLNRLRAIFPPEVSGLVIFMIGLSGGIAGMRSLFGSTAAPVLPSEWIVGALTLATMIGLNVWGKGIVRMLCALIGLVVGYVAAAFAGLIDKSVFVVVDQAPWVGLPSFSHISWSFNAAMIAPFAIASVANAMKAVGTLTICQKINDANWVRPDMRSLRGGVLADGLSSVLAGAGGAVGINTSTPAVGLAAATGVTSRTVAFAIGTIFIILGFLPKLPAALGLMPRPVIVAALLFAVSFIMINGIQVISSRLLDARRTMVIGLSIVAGAAVEVFPSIAASVPPAIAPMIGSSLVLSTVTALFLNVLFRIGVKKTARLNIDDAHIDPQKIDNFFQTQCAAWGARPDIAKRAAFGTKQLIDAVADEYRQQGSIIVEASFDEFNLDVRLFYQGKELKFPDQRPTNAEIRETEEGARLLAGFLLRRNADRVRSEWKDGKANVLFHFDH